MANYQPGRMAEKSMFYGASEAPRIHGVHTNGKYDRAPRFKNQYFVAFKFNEVHTTFNSEEMRHITYRVKSFDAPKFQIDTEELNQYNKRRIIPTKIQFQPIQVVFHDDRSNMVQDFWKKIYNFYFQDGVDKAPRKGAPSYGITVPDKVIESAGFGGATTTLGYDGFGYDISGKIETKNLFSYMSLYLVANNDFTRIDMVNPYVQAMSHDTFSQDMHSELGQITLDFVFETVVYKGNDKIINEGPLVGIIGTDDIIFNSSGWAVGDGDNSASTSPVNRDTTRSSHAKSINTDLLYSGTEDPKRVRLYRTGHPPVASASGYPGLTQLSSKDANSTKKAVLQGAPFSDVAESPYNSGGFQLHSDGSWQQVSGGVGSFQGEGSLGNTTFQANAKATGNPHDKAVSFANKSEPLAGNNFIQEVTEYQDPPVIPAESTPATDAGMADATPGDDDNPKTSMNEIVGERFMTNNFFAGAPEHGEAITQMLVSMGVNPVTMFPSGNGENVPSTLINENGDKVSRGQVFMESIFGMLSAGGMTEQSLDLLAVRAIGGGSPVPGETDTVNTAGLSNEQLLLAYQLSHMSKEDADAMARAAGDAIYDEMEGWNTDEEIAQKQKEARITIMDATGNRPTGDDTVTSVGMDNDRRKIELAAQARGLI